MQLPQNDLASTPFNPRRRRNVGIAVAVGLLSLVGAGAMTAAHGAQNAEAERVQAASRTVRTHQWLEARSLDPSSSVDMMKALILACEEIRSRGDRC